MREGENEAFQKEGKKNVLLVPPPTPPHTKLVPCSLSFFFFFKILCNLGSEVWVGQDGLEAELEVEVVELHLLPAQPHEHALALAVELPREQRPERGRGHLPEVLENHRPAPLRRRRHLAQDTRAIGGKGHVEGRMLK